MRKCFFLIMLFALVFLLTSCEGNQPPKGARITPDEVSGPTQPQAASHSSAPVSAEDPV